MSIETPTTPETTVGSLPDPSTDTRRGPRPVAHGAATTAVFNGVDDDLSLAVEPNARETVYQSLRHLWRSEVGDRDSEPLMLDIGDAFDWLPAAREGRDWVLLLTSSRWVGGTGEGDDFSAWYQYHLKLRELDDDGETHKPPMALHVEIIPQSDELVYPDGNDYPIRYGEGTRVICWTTWADSSDEIESRMLDTLELVSGASRDQLESARRYESRKLIKSEAHVRFHIGWKRQVIDALDNSRELIAFGGQSEIEASQSRKKAGYVESVVDADRWELLGFERESWNIELKVYQADDWERRDNDDPYRHPKIEASYAGVVGDGALPHVDEWEEVMQTLREVVSAHLDWAGVSRDELIADEYQVGSALPEYEYSHPTGRREQLRERYECVSTEIYREALKASTDSVYDILRTVAKESGATYDLLERRTGLARSTIRYHVRRLDENGVVDRVGNPVMVVFPSLVVLDKADDILRKVYPDDMADDMTDRADERRQRREERDDPDSVDDSSGSEPVDDSEESSPGSSWAYFDDLELEPGQLATALEEHYLGGRDVRVRTDRRDWVS